MADVGEADGGLRSPAGLNVAALIDGAGESGSRCVRGAAGRLGFDGPMQAGHQVHFAAPVDGRDLRAQLWRAGVGENRNQRFDGDRPASAVERAADVCAMIAGPCVEVGEIGAARSRCGGRSRGGAGLPGRGGAGFRGRGSQRGRLDDVSRGRMAADRDDHGEDPREDHGGGDHRCPKESRV